MTSDSAAYQHKHRLIVPCPASSLRCFGSALDGCTTSARNSIYSRWLAALARVFDHPHLHRDLVLHPIGEAVDGKVEGRRGQLHAAKEEALGVVCELNLQGVKTLSC